MKIVSQTPEYELVAPKEAIIAWKQNLVTKQVLNIVNAELQRSCERVGHGETLGENLLQDTARAVGYVEGLEFLTTTMMEVTQVLEDSEERENEHKSKSASTIR